MLPPSLIPFFLSVSLWGSYVLALPTPIAQVDDAPVPFTTSDGSVKYFIPIPTPTTNDEIVEPPHSTDSISVSVVTHSQSTVQVYVTYFPDI